MVKSDFDKPYEPHPHIQNDMRAGLAAEHSAHHLGRISAALERIATALEKRGSPETDDGGTF